MAKVKVLRYVGQRSRSSSLGQNFWYGRKGLITRNVHVKYGSSTSNASKFKTKINALILEMQVTRHDQGHKVINLN